MAICIRGCVPNTWLELILMSFGDGHKLLEVSGQGEKNWRGQGVKGVRKGGKGREREGKGGKGREREGGEG